MTIHVNVPYSGGSNQFKTFETYQILFKLLYSAGLLVVGTDSKLSQCMLNYWSTSVFNRFETFSPH